VFGFGIQGIDGLLTSVVTKVCPFSQLEKCSLLSVRTGDGYYILVIAMKQHNDLRNPRSLRISILSCRYKGS
jgi:hypothetical protein